MAAWSDEKELALPLDRAGDGSEFVVPGHELNAPKLAAVFECIAVQCGRGSSVPCNY